MKCSEHGMLWNSQEKNNVPSTLFMTVDLNYMVSKLCLGKERETVSAAFHSTVLNGFAGEDANEKSGWMSRIPGSVFHRGRTSPASSTSVNAYQITFIYTYIY